MPPTDDREKNRFSARAKRYARVGTRVGGVAARIAGQRLIGAQGGRPGNALALAAALGGLKGPIMKVAQLLATIPDALPPEYANELIKLQSQAPPMGWAFVKRRMQAELGPDWQKKFGSFEHHPAAAASLGQVHCAVARDGSALACKLQYPDMQSAVEADLKQLQLLFAIRRRFDPAIDTSEIAVEIAARLREELDYEREAKHVALYRAVLDGEPSIRVPKVWPDLSTGRLLTMEWLEGRKLLEHKDASLAVRNRLGTAMFTAWWFPFSRFGVIHGDPHLGNYTVEPMRQRASDFFAAPHAIYGVTHLAAMMRLLPERDPHPGLYSVFEEILDRLEDPGLSAPLVVRFELQLLGELGFGLDLAQCASTGTTDDLVYVSPKSGRAVSRSAGEPWADRMLRLPAFLGDADTPPSGRDLADGFALTGFFLSRHVLEPRGLALSDERAHFIAALARVLPSVA